MKTGNINTIPNDFYFSLSYDSHAEYTLVITPSKL
jgi:hypothetical protein